MGIKPHMDHLSAEADGLDGTVVWAANQALILNKEIFVKAEPAYSGDLDFFWRRK